MEGGFILSQVEGLQSIRTGKARCDLWRLVTARGIMRLLGYIAVERKTEKMGQNAMHIHTSERLLNGDSKVCNSRTVCASYIQGSTE